MRALPDDNLAYPVLIALSNGGVGSGFFMHTATSMDLVTARHVLLKPGTNTLLAPTATLTAQDKDLTNSAQNVIQLDLTRLQSDGRIAAHTSKDVLVVSPFGPRDSNGAFQARQGTTLQTVTTNGITGVGHTFTKPFADVLIGNDVYLFGYPASLSLKQMSQIDYSHPLLRKGVVAGKNIAAGTLILDCPVYPGNSGGLVIEVEEEGGQRHFRAIGIVSQFVPLVETWLNSPHGYSNIEMSNSGYCIAESIEVAEALSAGLSP